MKNKAAITPQLYLASRVRQKRQRHNKVKLKPNL